MPRPDEGLIHSWLDGQLPPDEAARVEQLLATDAEWAAAAAEARGLVAATSRILNALDHVPAGVVPKGTATPVARRLLRQLPWWTKMAAAVVLVAGASTLVMSRTPEPEIARPPQVADVVGKVDLPAASKPTAVAKRAPAAAPALASRVAPSVTPSPVPATVPAATITATAPAAAQVGGVSVSQGQGAAAADRESRVQQLDQARQSAASVMVQRTSGKVRPDMAPEPPAMESARNFAAPAPIGVRVRLMPGGCHALRESRTSATVGAVMRGERLQGDTLFLVSAGAPSPARAWLVAADGVVRGVLTLAAEGRGMVLVTAIPAACPMP